MILALITLISLSSQVGRALRVLQPYKVVAVDGEVQLRCSYHARGRPEEMRVSLYRGEHRKERVCTHSFNTTLSDLRNDGPILCRGELSPGGVDLIISGLKGEDTDIYHCQIEILYPPPYLIKFGNGTLIYIPEKMDCPAPLAQMQEEPHSTKSILPILVLAFFILIIITVIIFSYKFFKRGQRRIMYPQMPPVMTKRVDCRFGYENFL
ncbi:hypothetical protein GJAV_G00202000 [Gymnothorax javanicus]|nr:hypothetical protein GJAV_G00202000 [Gymnothorax javanicus]